MKREVKTMQAKSKSNLYQERIAEIKSLYTHWEICEISDDNHIHSAFHNYGTECCPDSDCHGDSSCGAAGVLRLPALAFPVPFCR